MSNIKIARLYCPHSSPFYRYFALTNISIFLLDNRTKYLQNFACTYICSFVNLYVQSLKHAWLELNY